MENHVEIRKIRQDLDMLVMLYQRLVDGMIPVEEATPEEKAAIEDTDEVCFLSFHEPCDGYESGVRDHP